MSVYGHGSYFLYAIYAYTKSLYIYNDFVVSNKKVECREKWSNAREAERETCEDRRAVLNLNSPFTALSRLQLSVRTWWV